MRRAIHTLFSALGREAAGLRRLSRCRAGATAVEFAVASVPLIILIFGFTATSAVFMSLASMQSNAQYAARLMSTGQVSQNNNGAISAANLTATTTCASGMSTAKIEYYACNGLPSWATFTVTTTANCSSTPTVTVSLSANAATAAIADVVAIFSGKTIQAQSVFMKEGTCP